MRYGERDGGGGMVGEGCNGDDERDESLRGVVGCD